ncbi:MAG: LPS-assembly protein LptD, partial [Hyphomonadaceae bacterium]
MAAAGEAVAQPATTTVQDTRQTNPNATNAAAAESPVALEADTVTADDRAQTITAEGDVEARYEGRTLRADRIIYNLADGTIHAQGNVQMVDRDGSVRYADEIEIDENLELGVATELQARIGETGRVAARTAVRRSEGKSELSHIIFTSCPICEEGDRPPTWALRARRAVQDTENRTISYHGAVLEISGVPILYMPYFAHPDPSSGPTSGFLTPDLGRNRRLGAFYNQPYHWAISPYQDMTLSLQVHENVRPLAGVEYRKRFYSGDLNLLTSFTQERDFDGEGNRIGEESWRGHVFGSGAFQISDYWLWGFGLERASDDLYLRRYGLDGTGDRRGPFLGDSHRLLSQLYTQGQGPNSYATVNFLSFQGLRASDDSDRLPLILPFGEYERVFNQPILTGQLRLRASTAVLERENDGVDTARISAGAAWRADHVIGPGWVVSPFAEGRVDAYRINDPVADEEETFSRGVGVAGVEMSWPFVRPGENIDLLVEPIVMAAVSTGDNDPRIINEDSIAFELDDSNLFRPNAAPNYDLWETGSRVSLGVRATARAAGGQSASLLFGRRYRSDDDSIFTPDTNLDGNASDWVAAATVDLGPHLGADI